MRRPITMLWGGCALALACTPAGGEVFQCVDESGRILLTDSGCPPGFSVNLVVGEPHSPEDELLAYREEAEERAAALDAARLAAEAETARLRAELDERRWDEQAAQDRLDTLDQDRLDALDRKLDSLLEQPQVYGGTALVPVPALPLCGPGGRPWVDCRPRRERYKAQVYRPDSRQNCGTFGCPPGITHAPWDQERRLRDRRDFTDRPDLPRRRDLPDRRDLPERRDHSNPRDRHGVPR